MIHGQMFQEVWSQDAFSETQVKHSWDSHKLIKKAHEDFLLRFARATNNVITVEPAVRGAYLFAWKLVAAKVVRSLLQLGIQGIGSLFSGFDELQQSDLHEGAICIAED